MIRGAQFWNAKPENAKIEVYNGSTSPLDKTGVADTACKRGNKESEGEP